MDAVDDTSHVLSEGQPVASVGAEEVPSLLTIIVDAHADGWAAVKGISLREAAAAVMVLVNAHLALSNANHVAVIGFNGNGPKYLFPRDPFKAFDGSENGESAGSIHAGLKGTMYGQFEKVDATVLQGLESMLKEPAAGHCSVSGPLTRALCYTDRLMRENAGLKGRVLLLSVSGDLPAKYISTMNCIFAAQKLKMPIDVCKLGGEKMFLQQASDFTGGAFIEIRQPQGLVQYFMTAFSVDASIRAYVNIPTEQNVDFRAVCYISKDVVEIGYVCSVCLTIMKNVPKDNTCPVCNTHFS